MRKKRVSNARKLKDGRGSGHGKYYKPWIYVYEFSSIGRQRLAKSLTVGRVHHLMSDLESYYFEILDFTESVADIREQFPLLDTGLAKAVAFDLGFNYPQNTGGEDHVLTSDFSVTLRENGSFRQAIRTVKPSAKLEEGRVVELLLMEREYWLRKGVSDWGIVTEREISKTRALNIRSLKSCLDLARNPLFHGCPAGRIAEMGEKLKGDLEGQTGIEKEIVRVFEQKHGLRRGAGVCLFKNLAARREIEVDLGSPHPLI